MLQHAFRSEGGYLPKRNIVSTIEYEAPASTEQEAQHALERRTPDQVIVSESFGPFEGFLAQCGHVTPLAMNLPADNGTKCPICLSMTALLERASNRTRHVTTRDAAPLRQPGD